jgi:hypothetical protein
MIAFSFRAFREHGDHAALLSEDSTTRCRQCFSGYAKPRWDRGILAYSIGKPAGEGDAPGVPKSFVYLITAVPLTFTAKPTG